MPPTVPTSKRRGLSYSPLIVEKKRRSKKTPRLLSGCPVEIQLLILNNLPKAGILSMTYVNKHFGNIAQPYLFGEVDVGCHGHDERPSSLALVIKTLLNKPHLANSARALRVDGLEFHRTPNVKPRTGLCGIDVIKATDVIKQTGADFADSWAEAISAGEVDALVTLLIALLPKTKSIYLGKDYSLEIRYLTMMLDPKIRSQPNVRLPALEHLRNVTVRNELSTNFHENIDLSNTFWSFFHLSQLETLAIFGVFPAVSGWPPEECPRVMDRLNFLDLRRVGETQLSSILALTPNISFLSWTYSCRPVEEADPRNVTLDMDVLRYALRPFKQKLTRLHILADDGTQFIPFDNSRAMSIRGNPLSLEKFSSLRDLIVPWVLIQGPSFQGGSESLLDKLPQTLTTLTLTADLCLQGYWRWNKKTVQKALRQFFRRRSETETDLKELYLAGSAFGVMFSLQECATLQRVGFLFGLKLQVIPYSPMLERYVDESLECPRRYGPSSVNR